MEYLVSGILGLPLLAAAWVGIRQLFGQVQGDQSEVMTAWAVILATLVSTLLCVGLAIWPAAEYPIVTLGTWLNSELFVVPLSFYTGGLNMHIAAVFAVIMLSMMRFAVNYLHREAGFHRFFFILSLFAAAILMLLLSATMIGTFIGWELAGVCSYLLVAYAYNSAVPVFNATRIFITNRIGDVAFLLGIGLSFSYIGDVSWQALQQAAPELTVTDTTVLALCFAIAALVKSAQIPFTPWLARAMEGPTVSSAVFYGAVSVHAGVFLVIFLQALFTQSFLAMSVLLILGILTAGYSFWVGLTQTDVKSSYCFAISGQLGLMFAECGLGLWQVATWHMLLHALLRSYQMLHAPGFIQQVGELPQRSFLTTLGKVRWVYVVSLQRFWLDPIADWTIVHPALRLAKDLSYFDDHVIDSAMGIPAPAINALASLAQLEEQKIGANLDNELDNFARGSGLAGKLAELVALILHWVEDRLVLRGVTEDALSLGRQLGHIANRIEQLLLRPRYLSLFVFITLLAAF